MLFGLLFSMEAIAAETDNVLEVSVENGTKYDFSMNALQSMWEDEGSNKYIYSTYNTWPSYETEEFYGPTVERVLSAADIDVDTLSDNDVIEFTSGDYTAKIAVWDFRQPRFFFPNGEMPEGTSFQGTTADQLAGKVVVPYIISIKNGPGNLRNIFGQRDPQEEQKPDYCKKLSKIIIHKNAASVYGGLMPTIESESVVSEGDRLFFDLSKSDWKGSSGANVWVYYTVSTDGTEPAEPTMSDILFNYRQYGGWNYKDDPEVFNYYEFTDAKITIIKAFAYARGYKEPEVMTLRYINPKSSEPSYEFVSSKGTDLMSGDTTTLTAAVTYGPSNLQYKFIVYNQDTNQWYIIKDFSPDNTVEWYTGIAGNKILYVDVKDSSGLIKRLELPVRVEENTAAPLIVDLFDSTEGASLAEKSYTTLTATASGGKSPYTYKFIVYNTLTKEWYKIRDFASQNNCDWYTGVAGDKILYVDVKDSAGTVQRRGLSVTVVKNETLPLAADTFTSSKGIALRSNDVTVLTAEATGGSENGYLYKFIVYNTETGGWYRIQDYSSKNTAQWYTGVSGEKILYLDIKDSAGNYLRTPLNVTVR